MWIRNARHCIVYCVRRFQTPLTKGYEEQDVEKTGADCLIWRRVGMVMMIRYVLSFDLSFDSGQHHAIPLEAGGLVLSIAAF